MSKKTYSVSEFKSKSLGLLERVARTRESLTLTKRGRPIAQVIPFLNTESSRPQPGKLKDAWISEEDIVSPLDPKLWKATE